MLTYAGAHELEDVLVRNLDTSPKFSDHVLKYDYSVVFKDGELVMFFDNIPFWQLWCQRTRSRDRTPLMVGHWSKRMERYCRLVIKLRARRVRLAAKASHNGPPAKQPTSKAR